MNPLKKEIIVMVMVVIGTILSIIELGMCPPLERIILFISLYMIFLSP
jgi:hypothetical protein